MMQGVGKKPPHIRGGLRSVLYKWQKLLLHLAKCLI